VAFQPHRAGVGGTGVLLESRQADRCEIELAVSGRIEDEEFRQVLADDDAIRDRWPVPGR
jgi:hypothetical protein